jgi:CelD/BcsL family acetyltransferase involved in cellulose biosynthesis
MASMSGQNRKRISKDRRFLADGRAQVKMFDSHEGFFEAFDTMVRLHQERWVARGEPGSFASSKFMRFHRTVAPKLLSQGWAKLWLLVVDDEPVCALYDFIYANKIYYYQSGLKIGEGPVRSPGLLLRDYGLDEAIGLGMSECDFLKGDEGSYKFGWGPKTRPIIQVRLARGGAKEVAYHGATGLVNTLRPLKRQLTGALRRSRSTEKTSSTESKQ